MRFGSVALLTFLFGICQAQAFGPILSAKQNSGYTQPQDAFEKTCQVSLTGLVTGTLKKDISSGNWGSTTPILARLNPRQVLSLKALILAASQGQIKSAPSVCDAGAVDITARVDIAPFPFIVVKAPDCSPEPNQTNLSTLTPKILDFLKAQCQIDFGL